MRRALVKLILVRAMSERAEHLRSASAAIHGPSYSYAFSYRAWRFS